LKYVLDTNILVAALNGDPAVIARLNEVEPFEEAILPALALAELRFGASSSRRVGENLARTDLISLARLVVDAGVPESVSSCMRFCASIHNGSELEPP
jgi:predicted nucleic acid-binding protein